MCICAYMYVLLLACLDQIGYQDGFYAWKNKVDTCVVHMFRPSW